MKIFLLEAEPKEERWKSLKTNLISFQSEDADDIFRLGQLSRIVPNCTGYMNPDNTFHLTCKIEDILNRLIFHTGVSK